MTMWYICTVEYYLAVIKNKIIKFKGKLMGLETIILSRTQTRTTSIAWFLSFVDIIKITIDVRVRVEHIDTKGKRRMVEDKGLNGMEV